ncbi:hypothetical protein DRN67_04235 [Candidatus Micrarchaeota archaeon]|nr:MAG: hypothetical protein DRN67_04235 [Candidatus Micrarchaeota archaeon]
MRGIGIFGIVLLVLASTAWADISFSDATVSPSTLRPGVSGTASFTVTNTGSETVSGLAFDISGYGFELTTTKIVVGDIGASGSTQVTIPFKVRSDVSAGVYTLQASTILTSGSGTGTTTTSRTFTIPITVSSPANFEVSSESDREQISPGSDFGLHLTITNKGGKASSVRISSNSSNFLLKGASQIAIGNVDAGETVEVDVVLTSSSSLTGGTYAVPIKLTYEDELGATSAEAADVGPIRVVKSSMDFGLKANTGADVYPGDKFVLSLEIKNNGADSAYAAIVSIAGDTKSSAYFIPLDNSEVGAGDFSSGQTKTVEFEMGVNGDTPPGYYALNATISFVNAQGESTTVSKLFGLEVLGRYDVSVIAEPSPRPITAGKIYDLSVQISNIGTGDLDSVSAELLSSEDVEVIGTPYGFIGELTQGDYSSAQYEVYVKPGLEPGRYPVTVLITFFDAYNQEHTVQKIAYVDVVSPEIAAIASGGGGGMGLFDWILTLAVLGAIAWYANRKGWLKGLKSMIGMKAKK